MNDTPNSFVLFLPFREKGPHAIQVVPVNFDIAAESCRFSLSLFQIPGAIALFPVVENYSRYLLAHHLVGDILPFYVETLSQAHWSWVGS